MRELSEQKSFASTLYILALSDFRSSRERERACVIYYTDICKKKACYVRACVLRASPKEKKKKRKIKPFPKIIISYIYWLCVCLLVRPPAAYFATRRNCLTLERVVCVCYSTSYTLRRYIDTRQED